MKRLLIGIPVFALLTALGAQISVPMAPVPMTLQSLGVVLSGLILGWRGGAASMVLYLVAGAVGLPVFSDGASGLNALTGPTSGYLFAFPLAAAVAGLAPRSDGRRALTLAFAWAFVAHLLILWLGVARLAQGMPLVQAIESGFSPFLIGAAVKSTIALGLSLVVKKIFPSAS